MSDKFKNKYRVPTTRLQNWDYSSNGYYFVTICTKDRKHYFGEITNNEMRLSEIGKIAQKYWLEIPNHFLFVILNEYKIMPNHIHGILIINKMVSVVPIVETPKLGVSTDNIKTNNWKSGCLGAIINQYKRICTIQIRKKNINFSWQLRFYDHIIRDEKSFNLIKKYIKDNSLNWDSDRNNSENLWI